MPKTNSVASKDIAKGAIQAAHHRAVELHEKAIKHHKEAASLHEVGDKRQADSHAQIAYGHAMTALETGALALTAKAI